MCNLYIIRRAFVAGLIAVTGAPIACSDYLTVTTPNVVNSSAIDPLRDAATLSLSARENFGVAAGWMADFSAFLVWEIWPAETLPEYSQFGQRLVVNTNGTLSTSIWGNLSVSLASNEKVIGILSPTSSAGSSIDLARSYLFSGYSMVLMGEDFCQAVIAGGPPLTSEQILDTAVARFTQAITIARAIGPTAGSEASDILNTALVGRARAELQLGQKSAGLSDANSVATGFTFNLVYVDNPAARSRLSNRQYQQTHDRATMVVPPDWRTGDPRVPVFNPGTVSGYPPTAVDGIVPFYAQGKYNGYASNWRLASRLEADYIAAEAGGTATMLAEVQARRAANGQPAYAGPTDAASVLTEFEEQRGREFYLEGKRLGDLRRNGAAVLHVPTPGQAYFKSGYSPVGDETCIPLPITETANNPNFPKP